METRDEEKDKTHPLQLPPPYSSRMWVYDSEASNNLSREIIYTFALAIEKGDRDAITTLFRPLNDPQKKKLLSLLIDYKDIYGWMADKVGFPIGLAKDFNENNSHEHVLAFLIAETKRLLPESTHVHKQFSEFLSEQLASLESAEKHSAFSM